MDLAELGEVDDAVRILVHRRHHLGHLFFRGLGAGALPQQRPQLCRVEDAGPVGVEPAKLVPERPLSFLWSSATPSARFRRGRLLNATRQRAGRERVGRELRLVDDETLEYSPDAHLENIIEGVRGEIAHREAHERRGDHPVQLVLHIHQHGHVKAKRRRQSDGKLAEEEDELGDARDRGHAPAVRHDERKGAEAGRAEADAVQHCLDVGVLVQEADALLDRHEAVGDAIQHDLGELVFLGGRAPFYVLDDDLQRLADRYHQRAEGGRARVAPRDAHQQAEDRLRRHERRRCLVSREIPLDDRARHDELPQREDELARPEPAEHEVEGGPPLVPRVFEFLVGDLRAVIFDVARLELARGGQVGGVDDPDREEEDLRGRRPITRRAETSAPGRARPAHWTTGRSASAGIVVSARAASLRMPIARVMRLRSATNRHA